MATFEGIKAPGARLPFEIIWSAYLQDDALIGSTWAITNDDGTLVIDAQDYDSNIARVWLVGGSVNRTYTLVNTITTDGGTVDVRSIAVTVADL